MKVFVNVRDSRQPHPKQLHLGYFGVDEDLDAVKHDLFRVLVEKWPRKLKPTAIDWPDAQAKLAKLRLALAGHNARSPERPEREHHPSSLPASGMIVSSEGCCLEGAFKDSTPAPSASAVAASVAEIATTAHRIQPGTVLSSALGGSVDLPQFLGRADTLQLLRRLALGWSKHSGEDADDLIQTTVMYALRAPRHPASGTNLRAWIVHIMKNVYIDGLRRRSRERDREVNWDDWDEFVATPPSSEADEPWKNLSKEQILMIARRLPAQLYQIIALDLEGHTHRTIASILTIPLSTAISRLWRARRLLRELIERQDLG